MKYRFGVLDEDLGASHLVLVLVHVDRLEEVEHSLLLRPPPARPRLYCQDGIPGEDTRTHIHTHTHTHTQLVTRGIATGGPGRAWARLLVRLFRPIRGLVSLFRLIRGLSFVYDHHLKKARKSALR